MTDRLQALTQWLEQRHELGRFSLAPASEDASFRRYYRVCTDAGTLIAMDAPPEKEDPAPFVGIARALFQLGLNVPQIFHVELARGFVLMSDLGTRSYQQALSDETVERLYGDALAALAVLQACGPGEHRLPAYDRRLLMSEMELFRDWYLTEHVGVELPSSRSNDLDRVFAGLADSALEQPTVCVHRDYHSRNLMVTERNNPGILDFQDAVIGPVTYDLVSLLRDCYVAWPRKRVEDWALGYRELALRSGILKTADDEQFLRWFDLMGVQRHLKAVGIFARLNHRDHKPNYLNDIPRTLAYVRDVAGRYPELASLADLLEELPRPNGASVDSAARAR